MADTASDKNVGSAGVLRQLSPVFLPCAGQPRPDSFINARGEGTHCFVIPTPRLEDFHVARPR